MTRHRSQFLFLFLAVSLVACQSKQTTNKESTPLKPAVDPMLLPENFKYSLYFSASGIDNKPQDTWTIDTTGTMAVHVTRRMANGKYKTLNGVAALDAPDEDTLRMLIRQGKLNEIDSNDVTQQCAGDEHFFVKIVPLAAKHYANLSFDACAADYNLLLQPQRRHFRMLMDWWERMRAKYRPNGPE